MRTDPSGSYATRGLFVKIGRDGNYDNSAAHYDIVGSSGNSGTHIFEVQGSEKLRIDRSGRVVIGGTSAYIGGANLAVMGTSTTQNTYGSFAIGKIGINLSLLPFPFIFIRSGKGIKLYLRSSASDIRKPQP